MARYAARSEPRSPVVPPLRLADLEPGAAGMLRAGGYVSGRVIDASETSATIDVDGEATTIDYQDMRKARSRVDFGTGK